MAPNSATKKASLNGVVNGAATPVAIRLEPFGSIFSSGSASQVNS